MADEMMEDDDDKQSSRETAEFQRSITFSVNNKELERLNDLLRRERALRGYMGRTTLIKEAIGARNKGAVRPADRFYLRGITLSPLSTKIINQLGDIAEFFYKLPIEDQEDLAGHIDNLFQEARRRTPDRNSGGGGVGLGGSNQGNISEAPRKMANG